MQLGLIAIFLTGLATSLHCVSMCGTLVLTYSVSNKETLTRREVFGRHLSYNAAKLLSYTIIGAAAGLLGSVLNLTGLSGWVSAAAGLFMVLIGLNMFGLLPDLKAFIPRIPKSVSRFFMERIKRSSADGSGRSVPVLFGLMSGVMPCGPLQAMVLYAAGTGSLIAGGSSLFVFGLGTIPLMLAFGTFASLMSNTWKSRVLKLSGVVVIALGLVMVNRGLMVLGSPVNFGTAVSAVQTTLGLNATGPVAKDAGSVQELHIDVAGGYTPNKIEVRAGRPVRITFERHETNGCSKEIVFPDFGIHETLPDDGTKVIEFTPKKAGQSYFTCGMGMLFGEIRILPATSAPSTGAPTSGRSSPAPRVVTAGSGCGGGCCGGGSALPARTAFAVLKGGAQVAALKVASGYDPSTIKAKAGLPITVKVERHETSGCSQYLLFPSLGIRERLPDDGTLDIPLGALRKGTMDSSVV